MPFNPIACGLPTTELVKASEILMMAKLDMNASLGMSLEIFVAVLEMQQQSRKPNLQAGQEPDS